MSVEAVIVAAVPAVFHHDILAVVGKARHQVRVHDQAGRDRTHRIERFAARVALQRPNVDAFMKASVNNSSRRLGRIAHESILAAFPRRRFHSLVVALDVLVKLGAVATINRIVVRREREIQRLGLALRQGRKTRRARQPQNALPGCRIAVSFRRPAPRPVSAPSLDLIGAHAGCDVGFALGDASINLRSVSEGRRWRMRRWFAWRIDKGFDRICNVC